MALYAISDLHLSFGCDKPMSIFGEKWENYEERMLEYWNGTVTENDTVLICGDISWATYLQDAVADFTYINKLNGKKYILKGNHDYWWTTQMKMNKFIDDNDFTSISFIQNNSYKIDNISLCGTRGWLPLDACSGLDDKKIYNRELERLKLSIESAQTKDIYVALHYPPDKGFLDIMQEYGVKKCIYGHLHAKAQNCAPKGVIDGIEHILVSCDYLAFMPILIGGNE